MSLPSFAPARRHAWRMGVALVLLGACTPPAPPTLDLPTRGVPAEHAEAVSIDRFLAPTALGAKDELLCPWARGEPVPDASLARWTAEKRLTWRVVAVGPGGATLDGNADVAAAAKASVAAAAALATRCGTAPRVAALVAAAPETSLAVVDDALRRLAADGLGPLWMLVDDPTPDAAPDAKAGGAKAEATGGAYTVAVDRGGRATVVGAGGVFQLGAGALPAGFVEAAGCGSLATEGNATWADMVGAADALRGAGLSDLALGLPPTASTPGGAGAGARAEVSGGASTVEVPLHGTVAAFPLAPCDDGRCPCSELVSGMPDGSELTLPADYDPRGDSTNTPK